MRIYADKNAQRHTQLPNRCAPASTGVRNGELRHSPAAKLGQLSLFIGWSDTRNEGWPDLDHREGTIPL